MAKRPTVSEKMMGNKNAEKWTKEEVLALPKSSFENERSMRNYIVENIEAFTEKLLGDTLISFELEKPYDGDKKRFTRNPPKIDLFIVGKNRNYLVELKNPTYDYENTYAIGQILNYGRMLPIDSELVIVTSRLSLDATSTIEFYNLPIRYIYLNKTDSHEFISYD